MEKIRTYKNFSNIMELKKELVELEGKIENYLKELGF